MNTQWAARGQAGEYFLASGQPITIRCRSVDLWTQAHYIFFVRVLYETSLFFVQMIFSYKFVRDFARKGGNLCSFSYENCTKSSHLNCHVSNKVVHNI